MATMDLSINQELMGGQKRYEMEYGSNIFKLQEAFQQTDIRANRKKDSDLEVDNSLFSYSSFKKAMDLRIHNRFVDGATRTIFDDAEYFAKNCCYKLLPITFEQVDEAIIHTEHNYSLFSLDSESEAEEDCSRTMDYSQIREKNYKRRRAKTRECLEKVTDASEVFRDCSFSVSSNTQFVSKLSSYAHGEHTFAPAEDGPFSGQPLDLSAPPAVQDNKTEALASIPEETGQPDSDKENAGGERGGERGGIRVTITRPDEEDSYQPCDLFLNDIARLVPWLIDKDCFEVDILDRTCDLHKEFRKHRLYYVIAESTWRFFQSTNERIILTNDPGLGQPVRGTENEERPTYLVFDQFSLAKCLADYCQEIGGCFEYTCVEEGQEEETEKTNAGSNEEEERTTEAEENAKEESQKDLEPDGEEEAAKKPREQSDVGLNKESEESAYSTAVYTAPEESIEALPETVDQANEDHLNVKEETKTELDVCEEVEKSDKTPPAAKTSKKVAKRKRRKRAARRKRKVKLSTQYQAEGLKQAQTSNLPARPELKNFRITTRSKSTSEVETSHTSDKPVSRKRWEPTPPPQLPPIKRRRTPKAEEVTVRSRRLANVGEVKATPEFPESRKRQENKERKDEKKKGSGAKRILRSQKMKAEVKKKEKAKVEGKGKSAPPRKIRRR